MDGYVDNTSLYNVDLLLFIMIVLSHNNPRSQLTGYAHLCFLALETSDGVSIPRGEQGVCLSLSNRLGLVLAIERETPPLIPQLPVVI